MTGSTLSSSISLHMLHQARAVYKGLAFSTQWTACCSATKTRTHSLTHHGERCHPFPSAPSPQEAQTAGVWHRRQGGGQNMTVKTFVECAQAGRHAGAPGSFVFQDHDLGPPEITLLADNSTRVSDIIYTLTYQCSASQRVPRQEIPLQLFSATALTPIYLDRTGTYRFGKRRLWRCVRQGHPEIDKLPDFPSPDNFDVGVECKETMSLMSSVKGLM